MAEQNIFYAATHRFRIQCLSAHRCMGVQCINDRVGEFGVEIGRSGKLLLGVVRCLLPERRDLPVAEVINLG